MARRPRAQAQSDRQPATAVPESSLPISAPATPSWDKLEQVFDDRVARALARLGVPTAHDIRELTVLLEALNDRIAGLGSSIAPRARPSPAKAAIASATAAPPRAKAKATESTGSAPPLLKPGGSGARRTRVAKVVTRP
jgi:hypothetical protein